MRRVVRRACAVVRRGLGARAPRRAPCVRRGAPWFGGVGGWHWLHQMQQSRDEVAKGWPGCDPVEFLWDGTESMPKGRFVS